MKKTPKTLLLLYVLIAYVTLQFAWWAWLIYDLNADLIRMETGITGQPLTDGGLRGKLWMIIGEGSVFFALLMTGAYYIRKFVLREQRLARQEKNFLLATTHEFNSPIASVKLNLQTIGRKELKEEQRNALVEGALEATARLQSLVSNLLMASRIDAGRYELHPEPVDVRAVLERVKKTMAPLAREAQNEIIIESEVDGEPHLDCSALEFILGNLVGNAIKYAPGTSIRVSAKGNKGRLELTVEDEGPGIPRNERENVFRKFYRLGSEETRSRKGTGLGLYLVRELMAMQGGTVHIAEPERGGGALFKLKFHHERS